MKISVTQTDIDKGKSYSPELCPVALAIQRETSIRPVRVGFQTVSFGERDDYVWTMLPMKATAFIRSLLQGRPVAPFEFEIADEGHWKDGDR